MSNLQNTEILERLFEEAYQEIKEKYPASNNDEEIALVNVATHLATKRFQELPEPGDYDD